MTILGGPQDPRKGSARWRGCPPSPGRSSRDPWRRCCLGWDLEDRKVLFWQRDTGKEDRQVVVGLQRDHHLALTRPHCLLK